MAGTKAGGRKAAATNKARYGNNWYAKIGKIGGQNGHTGGFATMDEETGEYLLAKRAGAIGWKISKRSRAKNRICNRGENEN